MVQNVYWVQKSLISLHGGNTNKYSHGCSISTFFLSLGISSYKYTCKYLLFKRHDVFIGERKRKILCSRESDRAVVSDQRCHGATRPAVFTEPCNTECELRLVLPAQPAFIINQSMN